MADPTEADAFLAFLRLMEGDELSLQVAEKAEVTIQETLLETISAAETPEGQPWAPTRRGGRRAYPNAASSLTTKATGTYVRSTITGPAAYGNFGRTGKQVARPMLPDLGGGVPPSIAEALDKATAQVVDTAWRKV